MNRRLFVKTSLIAGTMASISAAGCATSSNNSSSQKELYKISLAEWSLHKALQAREIQNVDFPRIARQEFGLDAVEWVNQFFKDKARDQAYLQDLKKRCGDLGIRSLLIMCDGEGDLGHPEEKSRLQAVENHHKWVDAAKFLGCHSIRVNAGSKGTYQQQLDLAVDGLRRLSEYGSRQGLNVIVENHGGLSSNGAWLAAVIRKVGMPNCGTLPDFGNFKLSDGTEYDRYQGIREMMPFAKGVSAKSHEFDAQGNEIKTDYRRMMKIVLDAGYRGYVGIEYEGQKHSEREGIALTQRLLEKVRREMAG